MTRPSAAESSVPLQMIGESTYDPGGARQQDLSLWGEGKRGWRPDNIFRSRTQLLPGRESRVVQDGAESMYHKIRQKSVDQSNSSSIRLGGRSTPPWKGSAPATQSNIAGGRLMAHHLRVRQRAYCVTPKIQNQMIRWRMEPLWNPLPCLCVEVLGESGRRQTATFVIMRSGRGECNERRNLLPGSKHIRLCLACQAVENMFTPEGRSYSGSISSLARRNILRM